MSDPIDDIIEQVVVLMGRTGEEIVDEVKVRVGIQGPPRSVPGESPHKDTGALHAGIQRTVEQDADTVKLHVISPASYSARLEQNMDRPILSPVPAQWGPVLIQNLRGVGR